MSTDSIKDTTYQSSTQRLQVTFVSGRRTTFLDVPAVIGVLLETALDRDAFFSSDIRGKYAWVDAAPAGGSGSDDVAVDDLAKRRSERLR